jgi:hypothetical protein
MLPTKNAKLLVALALLALAPSLAAAKPARPPYMPDAMLIAAAKAAPLKLIDALETYCDGETSIGDWLKALTASEARRIAWTAGRCELVNNLNPLDEGGSYCAQATLTLRHPKNRRDRPEIEIYLEDPKDGKPGAIYAFRAMFDGNDGPDYIRFRMDFESEWRERFKDAPPPACTDDP